ncbi:serine-rich adhesin for platelets isoform X2 [Periplaneta americana]|uniref:serine-rich adhesin for platelets isoform X2 n=1 Tax=Periplaneta americana TaxID=6978 RepID=UPI0037E7DE24
MSGYNNYNNNNNNWRRRGRDSGPPGGRSGQNSGYWSNNHYSNYSNYNQYQFPQLVFPQQWNVSWNNQSQYSGQYGREPVSHNSRHPFNPSQSHNKSSGHSPSIQSQIPPSDPKKRNSYERNVPSSSKNSFAVQQKITTSPPLGSEEARKKTLAQATDKIKSCLLSFQNEKSEVLENLLSSEEQTKEEPAKTKSLRLEKPAFTPELQLTPNDLKVIGMVNTSIAGPSSEFDESGSYPQVTPPSDFVDPSFGANIMAQSSNSTAEFCNFSTHDSGNIGSVEKDSSNLERETDTSKRTGSTPQSISKWNRYTSDISSPIQQTTRSEDHLSNPSPCARPRSASLSCTNEVSDINRPKDCTSITSSYEPSSHSNQNEPKQTLQHLKQRIIQQFLKMGKNNLKDLINNPRSRKFEFAMNHLMKEHRLLLSRELRGLAQSRIKGQDTENQEQNEPLPEPTSLLDTNIAINLSHLPQEVIEQLGNLLQLDILDSAESVDFQPNISVDDEANVHDFQNIQALQVALMSEENIKREIEETEMKPQIRHEVCGTQVETSGIGKEHEMSPDLELNRSGVVMGAEQNELQLTRDEREEEEPVIEEGGIIKKPRKDSDKWPGYIRLGKGFMNRGGEFGNLFCEFPDFVGMGSTESEVMDEHDSTLTATPSGRQTDLDITKHPLSENVIVPMLDHSSAPEVDEVLREKSNEVLGNSESCKEHVTLTVNSDEQLNNLVIETSAVNNSPSVIEKLDLKKQSNNGQNQIESSKNDESSRVEISIFASEEIMSSQPEKTECSVSTESLGNFEDTEITKDPANIDNVLKKSTDINTLIETSAVSEKTSENSLQHLKSFIASEKCVESSAKSKETLDVSAVASKSIVSDTDRTLQSSADICKQAEGLISKEIEDNIHNGNDILSISTSDSTKETEIEKNDYKELDTEIREHTTQNTDIPDDNNILEDRIIDQTKSVNNCSLVGSNVDNSLYSNEVSADSKENSLSSRNVTDGNIANETSNKEIEFENEEEGNTTGIATEGGISSKTINSECIAVNDNAEIANYSENTTSSVKNQNPVAKHNSNDNTEEKVLSNICVSNEEENDQSKKNQEEDISVDELYGDLSDMSNAEDADNDNCIANKSKVENSIGNGVEDMSIEPPIVETEETNRDNSDIVNTVMAVIPENVSAGDNFTSQVGAQLQPQSEEMIINTETQNDEIAEVYRCNVIVKTEKMDDDPDFRTNTTEQTHKELTAVEASTQTQPPEELDSGDIQRMLQLLEKSSQLSPQLAKLLKDHFSSAKITDEDTSKLSNSSQSVDSERDVSSATRDKSPSCLNQLLNTSISPLVHVSESHGRDSATPPTQTSGITYPVGGLEANFRAPPIVSIKGKKSYPKRTQNLVKSSKPYNMRDTHIVREGQSVVDLGTKEMESPTSINAMGNVAQDASSPGEVSASSVSVGSGVNVGSLGSLNARRDIREPPASSNTKYIFFKMLEIDKEIQKLMEMKLELYKKLQLSLEIESPCTNRNGNQSPKSRGLQFASPTTSKETTSSAVSSQALCGKAIPSNNSNMQHTQMNFVTMNNSETVGNSFTNDKPTSTSTPMVMLPIDYVLGSSNDQQNSQLSSLLRPKLNERLKTFDTSVVEAVLNSFNLPDCHSKEDTNTVHPPDHSVQNKINGDVSEATPSKSKTDQTNNTSTSRGRRYSSPRLSSSQKEPELSEKTPSPPTPSKLTSPKKQLSKSKPSVGKEQHPVDKKKQWSGILTRNKSIDNSMKSSISPDSSDNPVKELRSRKQVEIHDKEHQENLRRGRSARQKTSNTKYEEESSHSDSSCVVEEKKETRSSVKSVSSKNDKRFEGDSSPSTNRPKRLSHNRLDAIKSSEQILSQTEHSTHHDKRDTRTRSAKEVEPQPEVAEALSNKKETRSSKRSNSASCDEPEAGDDNRGRITRKRKLSVKTETDNDQLGSSSQEEMSKPLSRTRSGRISARTASDSQDSQPAIVDENVTDLGKRKKKGLKIDNATETAEVKSDICERTALSGRQQRATVVSDSGQSQDTDSTENAVEEKVSPKQSSLSKNKRPAPKRKIEQVDGPPAKIQRMNSKPDILPYKLQDCFVMVKPLPKEVVDDTQPSENTCIELPVIDNLGPQRLTERRSSSSSEEFPLTEFIERSNKRGIKRQGGKTKSDRSDTCHRIDIPETMEDQLDQTGGADNQQDPLGDIPDVPDQAQPSENVESCGSITSSPVQLPPDLLMPSNSPGRLHGQCILPEIAIQDENSISTLISDTISVTSDGEHSVARRSRYDDKNEVDLFGRGIDGKDDCDRDSSYSYDTTQECREGTNSRASRHKSSKKHKRDRKSDGIERLIFEAHEGPILDIETVGRHVLAASEDGCVYCYSLKSGKFKRKYEGHNAAVTCLCVIECSIEGEDIDGKQIAPDLFFTGSLDKHLRYFRFKTGELVQNPIDVGSPIQCMDQNWGIVYVGTKMGEVVRFNIKTSSLIGEPIKIGRESVLTLKATKEGPRQVLIVGTRNKPIAVRDAATGLLLRTVCNNWSHTVYSLVLSTSVVYCGTKTGDIPAVEFTSGEQLCRFHANAGVVCMRIYNNLLFAGCYDGNIYVFSINDKTQVSTITGPGKMLLCMDIVKNRIIAGSKDGNKLEAWGFPQEIRNHLKEAKHR